MALANLCESNGIPGKIVVSRAYKDNLVTQERDYVTQRGLQFSFHKSVTFISMSRRSHQMDTFLITFRKNQSRSVSAKYPLSPMPASVSNSDAEGNAPNLHSPSLIPLPKSASDFKMRKSISAKAEGSGSGNVLRTKKHDLRPFISSARRFI